MFKRQKVILGTLLEAKRTPSRLELMKWLFLLRQETCLESDPSYYDFVPYRYGPFSFAAYRDLAELERFGYLNGDGRALRVVRWREMRRLFEGLPTRFQKAIREIIRGYSRLPQQRLLETVYRRYPWYASRSEIHRGVQPHVRPRLAVYTAGYEGESIDAFLKKLLRAGITCIIDVRNNPVSRKYGFSKTSLSRLGTKLRIEYVHRPELGVPASYRRSLETFEDYQELLKEYDRSILPGARKHQHDAAAILAERPSVLMCFEADSRCCHRGRLAKAISVETGMDIVHL